MTTDCPFRIADTEDDLRKAFAVRAIVFMDEQACPYAEEFDGLDIDATHVVAEVDGEPAATGRIRFIDDYAKLERLAIRKAFRGRGYGNRLLEFMLQVSRQRGVNDFRLHAQVNALDFYRKHGFQAVGERFTEAGIEHLLMIRAL